MSKCIWCVYRKKGGSVLKDFADKLAEWWYDGYQATDRLNVHKKQRGENMGKISDLFEKNTDQEMEKSVGNTETSEDSFVLGVQDVFELRRSNAAVVVGRVQGTVRPGMKVFVSEFGADEGEVLMTSIQNLEIEGSSVREATDCMVALKIGLSADDYKVRIGSIVHSRNAITKDVHNAYITAIGDTYVVRKNLDLAESELEAMSIADLAEAWRLFNWFHAKQNRDETEEEKQENQRKVEKLADVLCRKILEANEIYTVYDKATGEPHLFSQTYKQEDGSYVCGQPDILLIPMAYAQLYTATFPASKFEVRKIENGEEKTGIRDFLGSAFYLNGACGARICTEHTAVDAAKLVPAPDYGDTPQINIPLTNPDLMRWMLLIGQMGRPESSEAELIYRLYYRFLAKELVKANFVIPMKTEGEMPQTDENGRSVLKQDTKLTFPTMPGKYGRDAVRMYTDWKRLRMEFGEEWSGLVQPIEGMIDVFDCAINLTKFPAAGCYVGKEMFEEMKNMTRKQQDSVPEDQVES